jgi:hypothetical protein
MKVKCISNKIPVSLNDTKNDSISNREFDVKEGREYVVYALNVFKKYTWYCICEESDFYPMWNPCVLFDIIDTRLSRFWIVGCDEDNMPFLSFPEWVNDAYFYGELIENNSDDINAVVFRKYKKLMDLEFPDLSISTTAEIADKDWLICPKCIDAWESSNDQDALVKCPICRTIFNNPRYKNEWPHL